MASEQGSAATATAPRTRVPDFFIVGHEKCGTSALYEMLRSHPQIYMPNDKEPRFFAPESRLGNSPKTLEAYLQLFAAASPEQRAGEASPQYLRSPSAARLIADVQPDARIIAIFREPAVFLRSFHLQCVASHLETQRDLRKALELEPQRRAGKRIPRRCFSPAALAYSDHVRYVDQLRSFHAVFPPEHVLVLIYEDFRRDNEATVRSVLRFLDVDDSAPIETVETKPLNAVRSLRMHQLRRSVRIGRRKLAAGPLGGPAYSLTHRLSASFRRIAYAPPQAPDERLMLELRRRFKGEVAAFGDYLGRDLLAAWGYDDID